MMSRTTAFAFLAVTVLAPSCEEDQVSTSKPPTPSATCVGADYCLSHSAGPSGTRITASAPASGRSKGGRHLVHTQKIQVWWNLAPNRWIDIVNKRSHPTAVLLAEGSTPANNRFQIPFVVPEAEPGIYPILHIVYGGGGASSIPFRFKVTN